MIQDANDRNLDFFSGEKESTPVSDARAELLALFDEGTFSEFSAYASKAQTKSGSDALSGVITGYGAVDGALVFAFAQDISRDSAALDIRHAEKITELYQMALKAGAPVIGIFDSEGVDVEGGALSLSAYGNILSTVAEAKGKIPQIALLLGTCRGLFSVIATMFDFVVREPRAVFGAVPNDQAPLYAFSSTSRFGGVSFIHDLLSYLPQNANVGVIPFESADSLNRRLSPVLVPEDAKGLVNAIADNGMQVEVFSSVGEELLTAFTVVGGIRCGVFANLPIKNQGKLSELGAKKLLAFVAFCNAFRIPLLSFVHSAGLAEEATQASLSETLSAFAAAYISAPVPKISVIIGKAIGPAAVLFGSRAMGCDLVFALDNAEIGAMPTASAVAFAWNERITPDLSRKELERRWWEEKASAEATARQGLIDDIVPLSELRKRIASALLMLTSDGTARLGGGAR